MAVKTKPKESRDNPWAVLEKTAASATKPTGGGTWNSKKLRKAGDILFGTVGEKRATVTGFGPGEVLDIVNKDGETESLFLSTVLQNAIKGAGGFQKGDRVFVKYLGVPAGKRYATYAVGKA